MMKMPLFAEPYSTPLCKPKPKLEINKSAELRVVECEDDAAIALLDILQTKDHYTTFDFETCDVFTGLPTTNPYHCEVVLLSICCSDDYVYVVQGEYIRHFDKFFASDDHLKSGHNIYFDLIVAEENKTYKLPFARRSIYQETIYTSWLEDNDISAKSKNVEGGGLSLKSLMRAFGLKMHPFEEVWGYVPVGKSKRVFPPMKDILYNPECAIYNPHYAYRYSGMDAFSNRVLAKYNHQVMESRNYLRTYYQIDRNFIFLLWEMTELGIRLDPLFYQQVWDQLSVTLRRNDTVWQDRVGSVLKTSAVQLAHVFFRHGINPNTGVDASCGCSTPHDVRDRQIGKPNYKQGWPLGVPSTNNRMVLPYLVSQEKCIGAQILREDKKARGVNQFISSLIAGLEVSRDIQDTSGTHDQNNSDVQKEKESRVWLSHTHWNPVLKTGRISGSSNFRGKSRSLQNITNKEEKDPYRIRKGFVARRGYVLLVFDYSSLELRILAHYSGDLVLKRAFEEGIDPHSLTAINAFHLKCSVDEVKTLYKDMRGVAKALNFGISYGMKEHRFMDATAKNGVPIYTFEEAHEFITRYKETHWGVVEYMDRQVRLVKERGYTESISGRRRYVPDIYIEPVRKKRSDMTSSEIEDRIAYDHAVNVCYNHPIQATAGDIIKLAQVRLWKNKDLDRMGFRQCLQIHDELVAECPIQHADEAFGVMRDIMQGAYAEQLAVKLEVSGSIAFNWDDAK